MNATFAFVILILLVALVFDYTNGFHDAANSIATVVSTRVLSPLQAVVWAAFFNFVAFAVLGTRVAKTIAGDMVDIHQIEPHWQLWVLLCGLLGAIAWDVLTWYLGLPTSSSHALVGGLAGAAVAKSGWAALIASGFQKIAVFIVMSPLIGLLLAFTFMTGIYWAFHKYRKVD